MMCGRVALLFVLVALPATLAAFKYPKRGYKKGGQDSGEDKEQDECSGIGSQVQGVQDGVDRVGGRLETVAEDTKTVLQNQDELSGIGTTLENGQAGLRDISLEIRGKQGDDLAEILGAVGAVEANLGGALSQLDGDVAKLHTGQKTTQSTLVQTSTELGEEYDLLIAGLGDATSERMTILTNLQMVFTNTEELKVSVRAIGARLEAMEECVESLCAAPQKKPHYGGYYY